MRTLNITWNILQVPALQFSWFEGGRWDFIVLMPDHCPFCLSFYFTMQTQFFLPIKQSLLFFSGAGKFYLAHGLRQLTRDDKSDVRILNFRNDVTYVL